MKNLAMHAIRFCIGCHQEASQNWRCMHAVVLLALTEQICLDVNCKHG